MKVNVEAVNETKSTFRSKIYNVGQQPLKPRCAKVELATTTVFTENKVQRLETRIQYLADDLRTVSDQLVQVNIVRL